MFDFGKSEVCNLGNPFISDENVGRFAVSVDNRWLVIVEVLDPTGNVEHHTHLVKCQNDLVKLPLPDGSPFVGPLEPASHEGSRTDPHLSRVR